MMTWLWTLMPPFASKAQTIDMYFVFHISCLAWNCRNPQQKPNRSNKINTITYETAFIVAAHIFYSKINNIIKILGCTQRQYLDENENVYIQSNLGFHHLRAETRTWFVSHEWKFFILSIKVVCKSRQSKVHNGMLVTLSYERTSLTT